MDLARQAVEHPATMPAMKLGSLAMGSAPVLMLGFACAASLAGSAVGSRPPSPCYARPTDHTIAISVITSKIRKVPASGAQVPPFDHPDDALKGFDKRGNYFLGRAQGQTKLARARLTCLRLLSQYLPATPLPRTQRAREKVVVARIGQAASVKHLRRSLAQLLPTSQTVPERRGILGGIAILDTGGGTIYGISFWQRRTHRIVEVQDGVVINSTSWGRIRKRIETKAKDYLLKLAKWDVFAAYFGATKAAAFSPACRPGHLQDQECQRLLQDASVAKASSLSGFVARESIEALVKEAKILLRK
jgi:hypothetical protein